VTNFINNVKVDADEAGARTEREVIKRDQLTLRIQQLQNNIEKIKSR
jgi:hypothetical protein